MVSKKDSKLQAFIFVRLPRRRKWGNPWSILFLVITVKSASLGAPVKSAEAQKRDDLRSAHLIAILPKPAATLMSIQQTGRYAVINDGDSNAHGLFALVFFLDFGTEAGDASDDEKSICRQRAESRGREALLPMRRRR